LKGFQLPFYILFLVFCQTTFAQESSSRQPKSIEKIYKLSGPKRYIFVWDSLTNSQNGVFGTRIQDWLDPTVDAFELAKASGDSTLILPMKYSMATVYFTLARFEECIPLFIDVLKQEEILSERWKFLTYLKLEEAYRRTGNLKDAIPVRQRRIQLEYASNFWEIYADAQLYDEAIKDFKSTELISVQGWNRMDKYKDLAYLFFQDQSFDSAAHYYNLAYQDGQFICERTDYDGVGAYSEANKYYWTAFCQGMIGRIMVKRKQYLQAIPKLTADIAMSKTVGEVDATLPKRLDLALCFIELGEFRRAKAYIDTVRNLIEGRGWVDTKLQLLKVESNYFLKTENFIQAASYLQEYNSLFDSTIQIRTKNNLIAMTTLLDSDKQKAKVAEQKLELEVIKTDQVIKRNQRNLLIAGIILLISILMIFYVRYRQKMKDKARAEKDKATIEQQSEKLKELDQVKTKFFSNISHEFRTPLTLIQGPIDSILLGKVDSDQTIKKNLQVAQRNVNALRGLIDEILEFNKMEMGDLNLQNRSVLLSEYLDELCQGYNILAKEQKINFIESYQSLGDVRLELPIIQVERIIHNLMSNAMKHSAENADVKLEVTYQNDILTFSVIDNGPGIKKADLEKVFDRFYQTNYGKSLPHSTGLGLSYVKEISEILNGQISVSSEEGYGATFTFSMKAKRSEDSNWVETKEAEDITELVAKYSAPNNKILVVEDNRELAEYVVQVLGDQFVIEIAENGQVALDVMNDFNPDLIISDIMMPVMDGMELLSRLKAHETWKYKSIMMLTAKSGHEVKLEALSLGLDDYLTKPFSSKELEIRVRNILQNQHNRSQWLLQNNETQNENEDPLINELVIEIEKNIDDKRFGVLNLSNFASLSDRQLSRVVKKTTGLTPANLIKEVKLSKAKYYLEMKTYRTVAEVSYAVGFEKPSYFSQVFFERYGKKPSHYFQ
jgi:signal transduction histidine kinase/DNA-binding response OmpR family regulator